MPFSWLLTLLLSMAMQTAASGPSALVRPESFDLYQERAITTVSWGPGSIDVFGLAPNRSVWHKYFRGEGWQPPVAFQNMNTSKSISKPTAISTQPNRMDFLYITEQRNAHLRYWLGQDWNPSTPEDLGESFAAALSAASWGPDRINLVGLAPNKSYRHTFWDSAQWRPSDPSYGKKPGNQTQWEDFGGQFQGPAALASWAKDRMDVFGIHVNGSLMHKHWNGSCWIPSTAGWEEISSGPFIGAPAASSWGPGRLDVWAISQNHNLYHKFWDMSSRGSSSQETLLSLTRASSEWENLGGYFSQVPQVVHSGPNKTYICGQFEHHVGQGLYFQKFWDGSRWYPRKEKWDAKNGRFASQAALAVMKPDNVHVFGISTDGRLKQQVWSSAESQWLPSETQWYDLGNTLHPYTDRKDEPGSVSRILPSINPNSGLVVQKGN